MIESERLCFNEVCFVEINATRIQQEIVFGRNGC